MIKTKRGTWTDSIDWPKVRAAQKRGKYGRPSPGDQELCAWAFRVDPERYRAQSAEVRSEVHREIQAPFQLDDE